MPRLPHGRVYKDSSDEASAPDQQDSSSEAPAPDQDEVDENVFMGKKDKGPMTYITEREYEELLKAQKERKELAHVTATLLVWQEPPNKRGSERCLSVG